MEERSVLNAEIPEALRRAVKARAALAGQTVSEFVAAALRSALDIDTSASNREGGAR